MAEEADAPRAGETPAPESPPAAPAADAAPAPDDWETRFKYLFADFENFRKRVGKEREQFRVAVRAELLGRFLPLYEAAHKAHEAVRRLLPTDPVRRGIELLGQEWDKLLQAEGVRPVATIGGAFHPDEQEAVGEGPATAAAPDGTVLEVVQQGYRMDRGLLRPAKVLIARAPRPKADAAETTAASADPGTP